MPEQPGRPNGGKAQPLSAVEDIPPLYVSRERLTFHAHGKVVHIPLDELMERGDSAAVPLLLYGLVLKLQDIDASMRTLAGIATAQAERVQELQGGGAQQIVGDVVKGLREMGVFPPPIPGAPAPVGDREG
ncbi:MAG: hypothetical protein GY898_06090 [Proteobacteria bacterium]|nr:hypothetical protein [Pseudomonadota bacterium]